MLCKYITEHVNEPAPTTSSISTEAPVPGAIREPDNLEPVGSSSDGDADDGSAKGKVPELPVQYSFHLRFPPEEYGSAIEYLSSTSL